MSIPYYVRIFRRATSPVERRDIYQRATPSTRRHIRRHDRWCLKCFAHPATKGLVGGAKWENYCLNCYRTENAALAKRARFTEAAKKARLTPHARKCIDCGCLFESARGRNLCVECVQQAQAEVAQRTLGRTPESIPSHLIVNRLYGKFGHRYKSSLLPRIPLSDVGVFESVGR